MVLHGVERLSARYTVRQADASLKQSLLSFPLVLTYNVNGARGGSPSSGVAVDGVHACMKTKRINRPEYKCRFFI